MSQAQVYQDDGYHYGGNQSSLKDRWETTPQVRGQLTAAVNATRKKAFTATEISAYLTKIEAQGCGYVAATNIILTHYQKREKAFEKAFKIPYYTKQGRPNFEGLLLAFYGAERHRRLLPWLHCHVWLPYPGVRARDLQGNIYAFTARAGAPLRGIKLPSRLATSNGVQSALKAGRQVVLTAYFGQMQLIAPSNAGYQGQEIRFHTVVITGYDTQRQQLVVSSWGRKYYLARVPQGSTVYLY